LKTSVNLSERNHDKDGARLKPFCLFFLQLALVLSTGLVYGAEQAATSTTSIKVDESSKYESGASISSSFSASMHQLGDPARRLGQEFGLSPFLVNKKSGTTYFGSFSFNKDYRGEQQLDLNDLSLGLSTPLGSVLENNLLFKVSLVSTIPLSEYSRKWSKLYTAVTVAPSAIVKLDALGLSGVTVVYSLRASLFFHQYKTAYTGMANTQYAVGNSVALSYSPIDKLSLSVNSSYGRNFTYDGVSRDGVQVGENISFSATDSISISVGHVNGGSPLATNGREVEINIYDRESSTVYGEISYGF
jgi:hypothetical protein